MTFKNPIKWVLFAVLSTSLVTACGDDDDDGGGAGEDAFTPSPKPLPPCLDDALAVQFKWERNTQVWKYELEVGLKNGSYSNHFNIKPNRTDFTIGLDRDDHYYFRLKRVTDDGQPRWETAELEIPSCADRDEFQKKNPTYEEPPVIEVDWE